MKANEIIIHPVNECPCPIPFQKIMFSEFLSCFRLRLETVYKFVTQRNSELSFSPAGVPQIGNNEFLNHAMRNLVSWWLPQFLVLRNIFCRCKIENFGYSLHQKLCYNISELSETECIVRGNIITNLFTGIFSLTGTPYNMRSVPNVSSYLKFHLMHISKPT